MLTFSNWRFAYINTNCAVSCAVKCVALIIYSLFDFIPRIFAIAILKSTTTGRTLRLHLKIDFDTDLTSNITRHSCTISAELIVSSFFNNWNYLSFRCILGFFVFVCLCAAVYGVMKNNNLVRLSSIVPFHIIHKVNLYWRNNSAHKYNYFQTLFHTLAFHTNFSRIFHPAIWSHIFMSRIFSRPTSILYSESVRYSAAT